jgi:hypothetical protein
MTVTQTIYLADFGEASPAEMMLQWMPLDPRLQWGANWWIIDGYMQARAGPTKSTACKYLHP